MSRFIRAVAAALLTGALTATAATATGQHGERDTIILIYKSDVDGRPLAGAVFHISGPGIDGTATSGADGNACVEGLPAPNDGLVWTVTEVQAPTGYALDPSPQTTNGDDDRNADCQRAGESPDLRFTNRPAPEIEPPPTPTPSVSPPAGPPTPGFVPPSPIAPFLPDTAVMP